MRKAAESAAKWLADKAKSNPKLNPIPYALFKSIVNKQIEWAAKRGETLDFTELAETVRTELLKVGIYTMSDSKKETHSAHEPAEAQTGEAITPLLIRFHSAGEAASMMVIFDWLHKIFMKAAEEKYSGLKLTASKYQEVEHHA